MLGGVLMPLVVVPVLAVAETPVVIGPILAAWFVLGRINKLLAVPGAVVAAGITVLAYGDLSAFDAGGWVTAPVFVMPEVSLAAVLGIGLPLYVVTMATQNVPGLAVMRAHGYAPEPGPLLSVVGGFSVLSAPGGAPQTCLAAITAAMCADEDSHPDPGLRYWSAVMAGIFYCVLGIFAGVITAFAGLAPPMVMASVAGVALLSVFANSTAAALGDADYREAAVITFVVTASGVTVFGLGGAVFTEDRDRGEAVARRLEVGCAFVNEMVKSDPRLPFGGVKDSGYGRELARFGLHAFVNVKTIWID